MTTEQTQALEQKRTYLQQQANDLIMIAENQTHSALTLLHKINVLGGTTEKAYQAVQNRIVEDKDAQGAYHAIALTQQTPDLPFDVPRLVDLILSEKMEDKPAFLLKLLKLFDREQLDSPPIPEIKQAILDSGDTVTIEALNQHLAGRK